MGLYGLLQYRIAKRRVRLRRKLHPDYIPTEKEEKVIKIIQTLIRDEESILMVAPITEKLYIKNDNNSMVVIIDDTYITLLNSKSNSYHDIIVHHEIANKFKKHFKNVLEARMNIMEDEMINGVINNLDYISKNITETYEPNYEHRNERTEASAIA